MTNLETHKQNPWSLNDTPHEAVQSIAEFLVRNNAHSTSPLIEECCALAQKAGHNYMDDVEHYWGEIFSKSKPCSEIKLCQLADANKETRAKALREFLIQNSLPKDSLGWEIEHTTHLTLSPLGFGFRTQYRTEKSEYNLDEGKLIILWVHQKTISEFIEKNTKKQRDLKRKFDTFMELVTPIIRKSIIKSNSNADSNSHPPIHKIKLERPGLVAKEVPGSRNKSNSVEVFDEVVFTEHGSIDLKIDGENVQSLNTHRNHNDVDALFVASIEPYLKKHILEIRTKINQRADASEAIISQIKESFKTELMLNKL
jgi:hypothetical protein